MKEVEGEISPVQDEKKPQFPRSTCVRSSRARCRLIEKGDRLSVLFFLLERAYGQRGINLLSHSFSKQQGRLHSRAASYILHSKNISFSPV
jgi:hypothetical protein